MTSYSYILYILCLNALIIIIFLDSLARDKAEKGIFRCIQYCMVEFSGREHEICWEEPDKVGLEL